MKDEIRVTVVATGVRQDRAESIWYQKLNHKSDYSSFTTMKPYSTSCSRRATRQSLNLHFGCQPSFDYNGNTFNATTRVRPAAATHLNGSSQLLVVGLDIDNISRPETGQLDSQLTMSTFSRSDVKVMNWRHHHSLNR